jgi:hypothetical protein
MRKFQEDLDTKLRHAGSAHNRFVLFQTLFWKYFFENWHPVIQSFNPRVQKKEEPGKRHFRVVK